MRLQIKRLAAIQEVDLEIDGLTVLAGPNEVGKSTILAVLRAFFGGDPKLGLKNKAETKQLLRDGNDDAVAMLTQKGGEAKILWPQLDVTGFRIAASEIARGEARFLLWSDKARVDHAVGLLGAKVSGELIGKALEGQPISYSRDEADKVLEALKEHGWEALTVKFLEMHTKLKGAWEQITRETWGAEKANNWRPEGWNAELAGAEISSMMANVEIARQALESAKGQKAISSEAAKKLEQAASQVEAREEAVNDAETAVSELQREIGANQTAIEALPPGLIPEADLPCPHCGEKIVVDKSKPGVTTLRKAIVSDLSHADLQTKRQEAALLAGTAQRLKQKLEDASRAANAARQALEGALQAKEAFSQIAPAGEEAGEATQAAQAAYDAAVAALETKKKQGEAEETQRRIERSKAVAGILAPSGLRREVMVKKLADFRAEFLSPLAAAAGLHQLKLDDNLSVTRGRFAYPMLSKAAKLLVDATLHAALCKVEDAPIMIIDDGEVLIGPNRSGAFKMLAQSRIPTVVAMAVKEVGRLDQIVAAGFGRVYWLEGGTATEVRAS